MLILNADLRSFILFEKILCIEFRRIPSEHIPRPCESGLREASIISAIFMDSLYSSLYILSRRCGTQIA